MTESEQVHILIEKLKSRPPIALSGVQKEDNGLWFTLKYIGDHPNSYALGISEKMHISRARVAVILKKLEERGLIKKTKSQKDSRVEVLSLTSQGEEEIKRQKKHIFDMIAYITKKVGYEEISAFVDTSLKIRGAVCEFESGKKGEGNV